MLRLASQHFSRKSLKHNKSELFHTGSLPSAGTVLMIIISPRRAVNTSRIMVQTFQLPKPHTPLLQTPRTPVLSMWDYFFTPFLVNCISTPKACAHLTAATREILLSTRTMGNEGYLRDVTGRLPVLQNKGCTYSSAIKIKQEVSECLFFFF